MRIIAPMALASAAAFVSSPAVAATPRELLVSAAFSTADKGVALARIAAAEKASAAMLARNPANEDAKLQHAIAIGYRGQLNRSMRDVKAARRAFEALAAAVPRDPEAQMALAGWHLGTIIELGSLGARAALGARREVGVAALDRAVSLGRGQAFFPGYASMLRIRLNPADVPAARQLAEAAVKAPATTPLDRLVKQRAAALLVPLRAGKGKEAAALAKKLMAFGRIG